MMNIYVHYETLMKIGHITYFRVQVTVHNVAMLEMGHIVSANVLLANTMKTESACHVMKIVQMGKGFLCFDLSFNCMQNAFIFLSNVFI